VKLFITTSDDIFNNIAGTVLDITHMHEIISCQMQVKISSETLQRGSL